MGFVITWVFTTQERPADNIHAVMTEILNTKYGESNQMIKTIREVSIENIRMGNHNYYSLINTLKEKGHDYVT